MPVDYPVWCARYGDYYQTEQERRDGYRDYCRNHAEVTAAFRLSPK